MMKVNNIKTIQLLKPCIISIILFIIVGYCFKTIETVLFFKYQDSTSIWAIIQAYFNITIAFCLYSFLILPVYLLLGLFQQKLAQIFTSLLWATLILLEIGLYIYYRFTGVLMGAELVARPFSEIFITIKSSSNLILNIISIVAAIAFFIALPFLLEKVKVFNGKVSVSVAILVIGILSVCTLFYQNNSNKIINNYIESKSFYFFSALKDYMTDEPETGYLVFDKKGDIEKNVNLLQEYMALYPHRTIPDLDYPMERPASEIPDVLSPFFTKSEKQPNIVIVIVESLGSYLMGEKEKNVSFTPFLDSLAHTGLYWKNCIATTPRTFGVIPSVIGSVPHGMRGFQFGIMPHHYSLFSILKNNDYSTNFFYGGDPGFDCMFDFISAQNPDHIDNLHLQLRTYQKKDLAGHWALYDHALFKESFNYLNKNRNKNPTINLYLTATSHEPFYREDKGLKDIYEPKTEQIFAKLNPDLGKYFLPIKDIIIPFTYLDDCMRNLIHEYASQPDFENTIFIITGDHAYGIYKNDLAPYSVPLIIWSPLLKTPKTFPNIVSHWSITPSIISYLQHNYHLQVPDNVAWCSDGLDTASVFNPSEKILFLSYERKITSMLFNEYFYWNSDKRLYKIDENLDLEAVDNLLIKEDMYSKFNTLKYINNYVYHNNKLIKNDKNEEEYKVFKRFENSNVIVCKTPDTVPSIHGIDVFDLMPAQKIKKKYDKIKIKFTADIVINDLLAQDQYMMLNFICSGKDFHYLSKENITKYIEDEDIVSDKKYLLSIEKEIAVKELSKYSLQICVTTNERDANWEQDKKITISNIRVLILGK